MLKSYSLRLIIMAVSVFVLLYIVVTHFWIKAHINDRSVDLLTKQPQVVYGQLLLHEKKWQLSLDELGEAAVFFNYGGFEADEFSQLQLAIDDLPLNYQVLFVWMSRDSQIPFEIELSQPNGSVLTELLQGISGWEGVITQIGLRIMPQKHLGLSIDTRQPIDIDVISLENKAVTGLYTLLAQYWLKYDSINYRSINHLKNHPHLPIFAQPLIFTLVWLLMVSSMAWVFCGRKKTHQMVLIISAWLFLDVFFLHNNQLINRWIDEVYFEQEEKLLPDQHLFKLAQQIKFLLGLNNDQIDKIKNNKVLILSSDRYQRARLIYHMLPVNSSFLDENAEVNAKAKLSTGDYILSYDAAKKHKSPINGELKVTAIDIKVEEVAKGDDFSIMRVIK